MAEYAVIETGSKQYRVEPNSQIEIELLPVEGTPTEVTLDKVLLVCNGENVKIGTPFVEKAKVVCDYLGEVRSEKVVAFKYRRRKNSRRIRGHRQNYLKLQVKKIVS